MAINLVKYLPNLLYVLSWIGLFCYGYYQGCSATSDKYENEIKQQSIDYFSKIIEIQARFEVAYEKKQQEIEQIRLERENNIDNIDKVYEDTVDIIRNGFDNIDGLQYNKCPTVSTPRDVRKEDRNTSKLVCFEKSELSRKLERDLAIAKECDRLANDYNTLLNICKIR